MFSVVLFISYAGPDKLWAVWLLSEAYEFSVLEGKGFANHTDLCNPETKKTILYFNMLLEILQGKDEKGPKQWQKCQNITAQCLKSYISKIIKFIFCVEIISKQWILDFKSSSVNKQKSVSIEVSLTNYFKTFISSYTFLKVKCIRNLCVLFKTIFSCGIGGLIHLAYIIKISLPLFIKDTLFKNKQLFIAAMSHIEMNSG